MEICKNIKLFIFLDLIKYSLDSREKTPQPQHNKLLNHRASMLNGPHRRKSWKKKTFSRPSKVASIIVVF